MWPPQLNKRKPRRKRAHRLGPTDFWKGKARNYQGFLEIHGETLWVLRFLRLPLQVHAEGLGISLFGTRTFKQRPGSTRQVFFFQLGDFQDPVELHWHWLRKVEDKLSQHFSRSVCFTFGSLDWCWSRWETNFAKQKMLNPFDDCISFPTKKNPNQATNNGAVSNTKGLSLSEACARITLESLAKLSSWRSWTQGLYIDDHWCTYCVPLSTLFWICSPLFWAVGMHKKNAQKSNLTPLYCRCFEHFFVTCGGW